MEAGCLGRLTGYTRPLCANFPAGPYQLIKEVSESGRDGEGEVEGGGQP